MKVPVTGKCVVSIPIPFSLGVQILSVFAGLYRVPVNLRMHNFRTFFIILGKCNMYTGGWKL